MLNYKNNDDMNCKSIRMACTVAAALLLAACSQDELAEQGTALPYGEYPLEISGVTMSVESSSEPWGVKAPQTRVAESDDRNSSVWQNDDQIRVGIDGYAEEDSRIYRMNVSGQTITVTPSDAGPVYWKSKNAAKVRAWYPADGNVDLSNQTTKNGLAYALYAETADAMDYNTANITLPFAHKLAKVRVTLDGDQADEVESVQIKTKTSCTLGVDGTLTAGSTEDYIPMVETTYNGGKCWEANVVPSAITKFKVNEREGTLSDFTPKAGKINTLTIDVAKEVNIWDIKEDNYPVEGNVVLKGDDEEHTLKLTLTDGANLTLEKVKLKGKNEAGNVIEVIGGSATITFTGENEITTTYSAVEDYTTTTSCAIYVSGKNATLTIAGKTDQDKLTVNAKNTIAGVGICGAEGGNIVIKSGTIVAKGGIGSAAIGANNLSNCGDITIYGGNITATGGSSAAAIGSGAEKEGNGSCGGIIIKGGDITATGGTDGTGIGGGINAKCGNITISGGTVTAKGRTGIGGGDSESNLTINGGTVIAEGNENNGKCGAGLGSSPYCKWGDITISGGTVTATAYGDAQPIGAGAPDGKCGKVTISPEAKVTQYDK